VVDREETKDKEEEKEPATYASAFIISLLVA
jgi:hypothetical protein